MKKEIRKMICFMSVTAALAAVTSLFASCGKDITENSSLSDTSENSSVSETTSSISPETTTSITISETSVSTTTKTTSDDNAVHSTTTIATTTKNENKDSTPDENDIDNKDNDAPKVVFVPVDDEFIDNPDPSQNNTNDYNQDVYEKLGVKVKLEGTNEQQAQQYYDAVVAAHPTLPWGHGSSSVGLNLIDKFIETENEIGDMSAEEVSVILDEKLAGRDYHDLSVEELYDISGYANYADRMDIIDYLNDTTSRDFNFGGWIA